MRSSWLLLSLLVSTIPGPRESLEDRRLRLESLSPTQAAEILEKRQNYYSLSPAMQQRIRAIHQTIATDAQAAELDRVLQEYCTWLNYLPASKQEELKKLSPTERIAEIKTIMRERESRHKPEDVEVALRWLDEFVISQSASITEPLLEAPLTIPEPLRLRIEGAQDEGTKRFLMYFVHLSQAKEKVIPTPDDFERLYEQLSRNGVRELDNESSDGERLSKVMRWAIQKNWRMPDRITDEEARFYNGLKPNERAKLETLRGDQFRRRLREMFMNQQLRSGFNYPLSPPKNAAEPPSK